MDTVIRPGELITGVVLPPLPGGAASRYRKARDRASFAFALASVAAVVHLERGTVRHIAVAFGGLAHRPWRARQTEAALIGTRPAPKPSRRRSRRSSPPPCRSGTTRTRWRSPATWPRGARLTDRPA